MCSYNIKFLQYQLEQLNQSELETTLRNSSKVMLKSQLELADKNFKEIKEKLVNKDFSLIIFIKWSLPFLY